MAAPARPLAVQYRLLLDPSQREEQPAPDVRKHDVTGRAMQEARIAKPVSHTRSRNGAARSDASSILHSNFEILNSPGRGGGLPAAETPAPPAQREEVRRLRADLEASVASKIMNGSELIRALAKARRDESLPTTLDPFDQLLGGGLPRGKMVELAGRRWSARFSIAMAALTSATSMGEAAVLVDLGDHFDPQLAAENGVDLRRLLWIRPETFKDAVMAVEMIAATGFQLVVLDAGNHPLRGRRVPEASWVRLGRTAEAQGTALLVSTPYPLTGTASEAVVVATRSRTKWLGSGKSPRVLAGMSVEMRLEKHRHMRPGTHAVLHLSVPDAVMTAAPRAEAATHEAPLARPAAR